jgi:hypothetical protein
MARTALKMPWEQKKAGMLLAHFTTEELRAFDSLQGGEPKIDKSTGFRDYSKLSKILLRPEIRKIFERVAAEVRGQVNPSGKLSRPVKNAYKFATKHLPDFQKSTAEELNPVVQEAEEEGIRPDNKLAWIPFDMAAFLIDINGGEPEFNPHTGLLMFGFFKKLFKSIVRIAAPIAAVALTPFTGGGSLAMLGTSALAGGTSYLANKLTGASSQQALQGALGSAVGNVGANVIPGLPGIGAMVNPHVGQALGHTAGRMLGGDTFSSAATQGALSGLGSWGAGQLGVPGFAGSHPGSHSVNSDMSMLSPSAQAAQAVANKSLGVGNAASGSLLSNLGLGSLSGLAIPAAVAGLAYKGAQKQYKTDKAAYENAQAQMEREKERSGFNTHWVPIKHRSRRVNPAFLDRPEWAQRHGVMPAPFLYEDEPDESLLPRFNKGGKVSKVSLIDQMHVHSPDEGVLVKGPGKGQQDKIKTSVPENSYIIDASATGMFGDGSSEAGASVLKEFEEQVKKRYPRLKGAIIKRHITTTSRQLPVWLSNDEYKFDPVTVTMLGNGSNTKGAAMLKQMVENIRRHKSLKKGGLPLKAKSPWHYLQEGRRYA